MVIKSTNETLDKILGLLKENQSFSFVRFGDTQLMLMDGWKGHGGEQANSPKLQILMTKAFEVNDPSYLIAPSCGYELEEGMRPGTFALYKNDADLVRTAEKHKNTEDLWHCEALHYGMLYNQEKTREIFKEINKHRLLLVAGYGLDARKFFPGDYLGIPIANAFSSWEEILQSIYEYNPEIVLFSAGPVGQVCQYFMHFDRPHITTIGMGSVFNALLEITSGNEDRAWIRDNLGLIQKFKNGL